MAPPILANPVIKIYNPEIMEISVTLTKTDSSGTIYYMTTDDMSDEFDGISNTREQLGYFVVALDGSKYGYDNFGTYDVIIESPGYQTYTTTFTFSEYQPDGVLEVTLEEEIIPSIHTFVVKEGEPIKYIVMRDGYKTIEETVTLTSDMTIDIVMEKDGPLYACYTMDQIYFEYAKLPLNSDTTIYCNSSSRETLATSVSDLDVYEGVVLWNTLTEDVAIDSKGKTWDRISIYDLYE